MEAVKGLLAEEKQKNPDVNLMLRIFVQGGGCAGFQYGFEFVEKAEDDDTRIVKDGVTFLVDSMSYQYLVGASVDFKDDLDGKQFVIKNPNLRLRVFVQRLTDTGLPASWRCAGTPAVPGRKGREGRRYPSLAGWGSAGFLHFLWAG